MPDLNQDFAVAVIIVGEEGIPVVMEPYFKNGEKRQRLWKFPGGHGNKGEAPEETAVREVFEEVGMEIHQEELELLVDEHRPRPSTCRATWPIGKTLK